MDYKILERKGANCVAMGDRWVTMEWTKANIIKALRTKVRGGMNQFLHVLEVYSSEIEGLYAAQKEVLFNIFQSAYIDPTEGKIYVRD